MKIKTSARLHLSLIDLNGSEGRMDGGIGLTLDDPSLVIECEQNSSHTSVVCEDNVSITGEYVQKILSSYEKMIQYLDIDTTYTFKIKKAYPIHYGLGLGTQLSLSTAKLIAEMNNADIDTYTLAGIVKRGGTSGIGVYSFDRGGLLVDGGHKKEIKNEFLPSSASEVAPPPLIARYEFPEDWKIILTTPEINSSVNGADEINIFKKYTPVAKEDVNKICYQILMKLMPAVEEHDLDCFSQAVSEIQNLGFKKIERTLQPPVIDEVINTMNNNGIVAAGLSSFGPTCFGITDTDTGSIKRQLQDLTGDKDAVRVTRGKNHGSEIIREK